MVGLKGLMVCNAHSSVSLSEGTAAAQMRRCSSAMSATVANPVVECGGPRDRWRTWRVGRGESACAGQ